ncbi:hypothetical protein GCM10008995_29120 [Halobellus salinus]|uniref:Uncharacterized protein n=1 Tax=Halobellus salinus TaxID=931585 RepID=A0A830EJF1_9EURY|nr:hypothetical protein [Halobellus salinus]GGJ17531.1 hypothetical protein GCM10008995_29120 [Halobellus salinus]SMP35522.1 hypothetical protein SAMN06265347_13110 [Halobellus salinus]
MTRKSRREIERALEDLEPTSNSGSVIALECDTGEYETPDGDPVPESGTVIQIPYSVRRRWEGSK